jgi:UMF1 family MFS transporter
VGFKQLGRTLRNMRRYPMTLRYLLAYLLYNDGIQTVIAMSAVFGAQELGMGLGELTGVILMVQALAFVGALLFGRMSGRFGTKQTIAGSLVIWAGVSIWGQVGLASKTEFWLLAAVVALVLGGSQALSRSLFSLMIPADKEAEFFSFYEVSERGTSWIGTALFGLVTQATGSMRTAIFSLIVLFVGGLLILLTVDVARAIHEAGNDRDQAVASEAELSVA